MNVTQITEGKYLTSIQCCGRDDSMTILALPDTTDIAQRLLTFLLQQSPELSGQIDTNTPLSEAGVDSFSLIEIVLFVERHYQVAMPLESLTPEKASSLTSLAEAVISTAQMSFKP